MDDSIRPQPNDDDDAAARGIVQCLRMLAEEAASLRLARTRAALQAAIDVCAAESTGGVTEAVPPGAWLH